MQQPISEQQDLMHTRLRGRRKCYGHCSLVMLFSFSHKELNTITYLLIFRSIAGRRHLGAAGDRRAPRIVRCYVGSTFNGMLCV